jgi:hypothetical protein
MAPWRTSPAVGSLMNSGPVKRSSLNLAVPSAFISSLCIFGSGRSTPPMLVLPPGTLSVPVTLACATLFRPSLTETLNSSPARPGSVSPPGSEPLSVAFTSTFSPVRALTKRIDAPGSESGRPVLCVTVMPAAVAARSMRSRLTTALRVSAVSTPFA